MKRTCAIFFLFALTLTACDSTPDDVVQAVADSSADFCSYNSFKYYSVDEAQVSEDVGPLPPSVALAEPLFKNEVTTQFLVAGVTETGTDPDLRVNFLWSTNEASFISTACGGYWYGYWFGYTCIDYVEEVPVGTVIVDFVDPNTNKTVFRGIIQGILDGNDTEERIAAAVEKVFEQYPPNITPCA